MKNQIWWIFAIALPLWLIAAGVIFACYQEYKLQHAPPQVMGAMVISPRAVPTVPAIDPSQHEGSRG